MNIKLKSYVSGVLLAATIALPGTAFSNGFCGDRIHSHTREYKECMELVQRAERAQQEYCKENPSECVNVTKEIGKLTKEIAQSCPDAIYPCTTGNMVNCSKAILVCALKPVPAY